MEKQLNQLLSNLVVEYHKLQNFHWYVKGKDFFPVHAKLEELYDYVNEAVDEVAEHLLMIGGKPKASLKEFLEAASIKEAESKSIVSSDVFKEVLNDFELLLSEVKEIKQAADQKDEYVISSLMDEYIIQFAKSIWMIKQVVSE